MNYTVNSVIEGFDRPDMYQGHGHAFEENLVSCLQFQISVYNPDSCDQFISDLENEVNGSEWYDLEESIIDNDLSVLKDKPILGYFTESELLEWFYSMRDQYQDILDANNVEDLEGLDIDMYLYGYLHIYKEID